MNNMRNINRIRKFCNELADIWESECPDWRFGQLIVNVMRRNQIADPFYIEEDKMMEMFKSYFINSDN